MYALNATASYIQLVIKHLRQQLLKVNIFTVHVTCELCVIKRYNPFKLVISGEDENDINVDTLRMSTILDQCKSSGVMNVNHVYHSAPPGGNFWRPYKVIFFTVSLKKRKKRRLPLFFRFFL